jgi:integrase
MAIKLEADGTYTVSYHKRHPVTNQPLSMRRVKIDSKAKANRIYNELVVKTEQRIKKVTAPLWEDVVDQYVEFIVRSDLEQGTIYKREKTLKKHTLPAWKDKHIDEIKTSDIHDLVHQMIGDMAESHRKFIVKGLKGVFSFAVDKGYIVRNPTPLLKFKIQDKIKNVLDENQILQLLMKSQELNWEWYPHYAVALYTGMRNGELYALTWDKVNFEKRQILINCSWNDKSGFKSTKSGDDRIVEIPKPLLPLLEQLKLQSGGIDFVLPRVRNWDKGEQAKPLRMFLQSIGLPQIRFHDLRASWATLLLSKGVAPSKVMAMGGWQNMDTMMIYMRKAGIDIRNSTDVLDDLKL